MLNVIVLVMIQMIEPLYISQVMSINYQTFLKVFQNYIQSVWFSYKFLFVLIYPWFFFLVEILGKFIPLIVNGITFKTDSSTIFSFEIKDTHCDKKKALKIVHVFLLVLKFCGEERRQSNELKIFNKKKT